METEAAPLIRTKSRDLAAAGVQFVGRVTGASNGRTAVDEDRPLEVSNVIWCTGYREDLRWIELPVFDDEGHALQHRGVVESSRGLYLLGQEFLFALASVTIPGMCRDAKYLADRIAKGARIVQGQPSATAGERSRR